MQQHIKDYRMAALREVLAVSPSGYYAKQITILRKASRLFNERHECQSLYLSDNAK